MRVLRTNKTTHMIVLLLALFTFFVLTPPAYAGIYNPPETYWRGNTATVVFAHVDQSMDEICQNIGVQRREGITLMACARGSRIWMANPCGVQESYAETMCHELAHVNGWPHPNYN